MTTLATLNPHILDSRIRFDAVDHVYFVDGERYPTSVSGVVKELFPVFDGPKVVEQYYERWSKEKTHKYNPLIGYLKNVMKFDDDEAKEEIVFSWEAGGEEARIAGTATHLQIELYLNAGVEHDSIEFKQFLAWRNTHPTWKPYRTEFSVFNADALLCGQIDSLWQDTETGELHMVDWKRVERLLANNPYGNGLGLCCHLPNTNYYHYLIQQNLYMWMIEQKEYGFKLASMRLLQIHPNLPTYVEIVLPNEQKLVNSVLAIRKRGEIKVKEKIELTRKCKLKRRYEQLLQSMN